MSDNTLERANFIAVRAQSLQAGIERSAKDFRNLATQEKDGNLSGRSGTGVIYAMLMQKADELDAIRQVVDNKSAIIEKTFQLGNTRFDYYQGIRNIHPDLFWSLKFKQHMRQEQMGNAFYQQLAMPLMETAP